MKGRFLGEAEVENATQRIEIRTGIEGLELELLWRNVIDRANNCSLEVDRL